MMEGFEPEIWVRLGFLEKRDGLLVLFQSVMNLSQFKFDVEVVRILIGSLLALGQFKLGALL